MRYNTVLFDLDGTLIDSRGIIGRTINSTLTQFGKEPFNQDELPKLIGIPLQKIFLLKSDSIEQMIECYRKIYLSTYLEHTIIYDGIVNLLERLRALNKNIGIITLKRTDIAQEVIKGLDLNRFVDVVVGDEENFKGKPFPDPIFHACKELSTSPIECVMVGDTEFDILAGKRAQCKTIGVLWGTATKETLLNANADFIAENTKELSRLLLPTDSN
jgi:pyrophosphatase PpaX